MHVCFPASAPGYKYPARSVPLWGLGVSMGLGVGEREGSGTLTGGHCGGHGDRTSCVFPRGDVGGGHGGRRSGKLDPASGCARGVAVPRGGGWDRGDKRGRGRGNPRRALAAAGPVPCSVKGSAERHRGSRPGWRSRLPASPELPTARTSRAGGGQAQRRPLFGNIPPQISLFSIQRRPPRTRGGGRGAGGDAGAMLGAAGSTPGWGKLF